jgi:hypothetical protein
MGRSHDAALMVRARELYEAGWKCGQISRLLASEFGVQPHEVTVRRWVDPDYAEAQKRSTRTSEPAMRKWGWKSRLRRLRQLRGIGLSCSATAAVLALDFDVDLTESQVEAIAKETCSDRTMKRLLAPEGASA